MDGTCDGGGGGGGGGDRARPGFTLLPYQKAAVVSAARFTWHCWARQTGKSFTLSLRRVIQAVKHGRDQIILSAGERQSLEVMAKVRQHCRLLDVGFETDGGWISGTTFRRLEVRIQGRGRIIALPANPLTARGFSGDVFLDEFAMHRDDTAIWSALFPALLRGRGELDVASTPRGCRNMFHRLRSNRRFDCGILTLHDAVAQGLDVDPAELREAVADDLIWRQEFCCEFLDESTSFMTHALIRSCHDERLGTELDWSALRRAEAEVYVGVDLGRHRDATVVWLWDRRRAGGSRAGEMHAPGSGGAEADATEFVTLGVVVLQAVPFVEQESTIGRILEHRGVRRCCIDATGLGAPMAESLVRRFGAHRVEGLTFTAGLKHQLAGRLRALAERGRLRIPRDEAVANDWHSIARQVTAGGHVRFDADRTSGGHGDRFWAAALGLHAAEGALGPVEFMGGAKLTFARKGVW